ncbi:unnamed protein product [Cylindrotheca closterium]|uniref:FAD-binding domain-containing protein n=1 Tax=Cylindrotheca closterium TaxID=2856 RepID=A0AAD2FWS4_9STRA|nr:unnamed protein product [Cylindrotheca closterium]
MKWRKNQLTQQQKEEQQQQNITMTKEESSFDDTATSSDNNLSSEETTTRPNIVITGAGIVGLVLALAIKKNVGVTPEIYEQSGAFDDGVGNGIGMYPNGLRVIRSISPDLLKKIQQAGYPYLIRRWEKHDGTEIATASESALTDDEELQPLGIRRWKLQKILFDEAVKQGIPIYFRKKVVGIETTTGNQNTISFDDNSKCQASLVLAADGANSPIRNQMLDKLRKEQDPNDPDAEPISELVYTGTTCLYGTAKIPRAERGICFPSSLTTKCHGCFYPTGPDEQCFQFHIPTDPQKYSMAAGWRALQHGLDKAECHELAQDLELDGWDHKYLEPLFQVEQAIKVPFFVLNPPLKSFSYGRIALVGDSAHPPVPYLGQGAQQGLEDAGTLSLILKDMCMDRYGVLNMIHVDEALKTYSSIRVPRTTEILNNSHRWGGVQQLRADSERLGKAKEENIRRDVFFHESIQQILPGVSYNYEEDVANILKKKPLLSVPEATVWC